MGKEALILSAEYLRIFTTRKLVTLYLLISDYYAHVRISVEAVVRATNEAMNDAGGGSLIRLEVAHLEKVVIITSHIYSWFRFVMNFVFNINMI